MRAPSLLALAVSAAALTVSDARSADLGGSCCADLEERVAELEATTARKANRKVKLTVSGQINESLLFWDDGGERNVYVVSNNASRTRFRFVGEASINADWSAGYLLEIGARYANSSNRSQFSTNAGGNANFLDIRHSAWYLDSKTFGRIWVGKTATATEGVTEINLGNSILTSDFSASGTGNAFRLRRSGVAGQAGLSPLNVGLLTTQISNTNVGEGDRDNVVKYVSPTFYGFSLQYSWGEDDIQDVALRYADEIGAFRLAGGIGYRRSSDINAAADGLGNCANLADAPQTLGAAGSSVPTANTNAQAAVRCDQLGLSASIMHVPSGIYVTGAYGQASDHNRRALFGAGSVRTREESFYLQAGIEQKWMSIGKTTLYGEYSEATFPSATASGGVLQIAAADVLNSTGGIARINRYELTVWGVGLTQSIDAAAMDIYFNFRNYQHDLTLMDTANANVRKSNPIADSQFFTLGGIIRF